MLMLQKYSGHSKDILDTPKIQNLKPIGSFANISVFTEYLLKENELRPAFLQLVLEIQAQLHIQIITQLCGIF